MGVWSSPDIPATSNVLAQGSPYGMLPELVGGVLINQTANRANRRRMFSQHGTRADRLEKIENRRDHITEITAKDKPHEPESNTSRGQ